MTTIGTCLMFAERGIASESAYRAFVAARLKKAGKVAVPQAEPLLVGLDGGVYLAWCPCNSGVGVAPGWRFAGCSACGRVWEAIVFPEPPHLERLDAILSLRPPGTINRDPRRWYSWRPSETLQQLARENLRHGWPIPDGAQSWQ